MTPEDLFKNRDSEAYEAASVLQKEVGDSLVNRLDWMVLQPERVLDLGCRIGRVTEQLISRYPAAEIVAADTSLSLLILAKKNQKKPVKWLLAESAYLPLPHQMADLIVSNLWLPWCSHLDNTLSEWHRVMRPDGLLMLSSLGPNTLQELAHLGLSFPKWMDMHDIGDALIHSGFINPVLDVEYVTLTYREIATLSQELRVTGLFAGDVFEESLAANAESVFPVTFEVIYGHAWRNHLDAVYPPDTAGEVRIPISQIKRR